MVYLEAYKEDFSDVMSILEDNRKIQMQTGNRSAGVSVILLLEPDENEFETLYASTFYILLLRIILPLILGSTQPPLPSLLSEF